ncbi:hypothetical protein N824_24245 [Pedobacter sp. V48]|nr:hypothetical protein N824_24245 [Pedobacter sp. V48]
MKELGIFESKVSNEPTRRQPVDCQKLPFDVQIYIAVISIIGFTGTI